MAYKCIECKIKRPYLNYPGLKPEYCGDCKKYDMVDVLNKKCIICKVRNASFNKDGLKQRLYCGYCKSDDMVNVKHKKCINCKLKHPHFNYEGLKPEYCKDCIKNDMVNVVDKKCTSCNLFFVNKKTNFLCSYCNPNKSKRIKTKENEIKELLELNNIQFIHDKQISNECCYKYRPDFIIDCLYYILIVEVDEDAHKSYDKECELIRMNNIQLSLELPTKFIRYNPDKKVIKKNIKQKKLLEKVKEWMNKNIDELKTEEALYLFY